MLDLNNSELDSTSNFDPSKIFGWDVINADGTIDKTCENVRLTSIDIAEDKTYVDFIFTDSKNNTLSRREYAPDANAPGTEKRIASQMKRIKHIVRQYVAEGTSLPTANTLPELWAGVNTMLTPLLAASPMMTLKLVFNQRGYLSVPNYIPFMEPAGTTPTQLRFSANDTLRRPEAAPESNGVLAADSSGTGLPF